MNWTGSWNRRETELSCPDEHCCEDRAEQCSVYRGKPFRTELYRRGGVIMQTVQLKHRSSSVHFLNGKMFIETASVPPVTARIGDERLLQRERSTLLRNWDDDGGAQPKEGARE